MATRKEEENGSRCLHFLNRSVALHLEDNLSPTLLEQPKPLLRRRRLSGSCGAARSCCTMGNSQLKRVGAKDLLNIGDRICIPISVQELPAEKQELQEKQWHCAEEEVNFLRSLELYKDSAIIVINKPPGMPVQGGIGIKRSLDELAATCLRYDHSEPPQLVHRLDRDSSGILVMGRTRTSATVLHSIFREKPCGASKEDTDSKERILQRQYWALVIGSPRRPKGLVSASLSKVVVGDGKSERITVIDNVQSVPSQHAITEYRVIKSTSHSNLISIFISHSIELKAKHMWELSLVLAMQFAIFIQTSLIWTPGTL
ncbi:hypothetical protein SLEP1_g50510 [Rubroshorea leprosula]|uniref:Pseudouridine synthase RsuA/RluA-like domain-containing protein n=1 Tax=Rubroshorea leprosula TaxID=152421 RepID=A0AAV5M2N7_9ROSI|nr:hypothetical protein SLEP1_g50510 [Rubroshorea leprosula]